MKNTNPKTLIGMLKAKFGDHSKAAEAIGYTDSSSYRRARREALESGSFNKRTENTILLLLKDELEELEDKAA